MADLTIHIPTAAVPHLNELMVKKGYSAQIQNPADPEGALIPNPQSLSEFAEVYIKQWLKSEIIKNKATISLADARSVASVQVSSDMEG